MYFPPTQLGTVMRYNAKATVTVYTSGKGKGVESRRPYFEKQRKEQDIESQETIAAGVFPNDRGFDIGCVVRCVL
jgi:hypothetical protein